MPGVVLNLRFGPFGQCLLGPAAEIELEASSRVPEEYTGRREQSPLYLFCNEWYELGRLNQEFRFRGFVE